MNIFQILTEAPKVGRTFQHLEDLVMVSGSAGAKIALARLADISEKPQQVRWKWDGKPTVYWGREPDGTFVMTGSGGWRRSGGAGKSTSAQEMAAYLMGTGGDDPDSRRKFATEFSSLWPLFEAATPADFRGYVYADLLYMRRPAIDANYYKFTPNQVTYSVKANSELGKRIARSQAAAVGHAYFSEFGQSDDEQQPISDFSQFNQTPGLIVLGPRYAASQPQIDKNKIKQVSDYINAYGKQLDAFLDDSSLAANRMTSFKQVLYKFNNQMARAGKLTDAANKFIAWLPTSGQSTAMQAKITDWVRKNQQGFVSMFAAMENIRDLKNSIIDQLDRESGDITASTHGQPGGEGYVVYNPEGNVKLVPRHRWTPHG